MKSFQKKAPSGKWGSDKKLGGKSSSDRKSFGRNFAKTEMFPATCSQCGNVCEVPFKPTGRRPILCAACFKGDEHAEQKRFGGSRSSRPTFDDRRAPRVDSASDELRKINAKLDAILRALS